MNRAQSGYSESVKRQVRYHIWSRTEVCQWYRKSTLGVALMDALEEMLSDGEMTAAMATKVVHMFDEVIAKLFTDIKQREQFKEVKDSLVKNAILGDLRRFKAIKFPKKDNILLENAILGHFCQKTSF